MLEKDQQSSEPEAKTTSLDKLRKLREINLLSQAEQNDSRPLSGKIGFGTLAAILLAGVTTYGLTHKGYGPPSRIPAFASSCGIDDSGEKYEEVEVINTSQVFGLHEGSLEQLDNEDTLQGGTNYSPDLKGAEGNLKTDFYVKKYPNGATARVKDGISSPSNQKPYQILGSISLHPSQDC